MYSCYPRALSWRPSFPISFGFPCATSGVSRSVMRHVVAGRTRRPTSSLDDDESKSDGRRPSLACPRPVFVVTTLLLLLLLGIAMPAETTGGGQTMGGGQATGGGRFSGLTISPSAVAAGATVSYAVAGMEAGEQLRFAPSGGGAEVYATLAANGSVALALPTVATYRVWRMARDPADTGLRVVAAEPWPPEPAQSAVTDGAVLSFFAHNFPDRLMTGAGGGVTSEVAPSASDLFAPDPELEPA